MSLAEALEEIARLRSLERAAQKWAAIHRASHHGEDYLTPTLGPVVSRASYLEAERDLLALVRGER